jgi:hypothetical protein
MNRRTFLTLSGVAGMAPLSTLKAAEQTAPAGQRDFYELRQYLLETEAQKQGLDAFMKEAAIPALNRLGIQPVGVFYPDKGFSPVYVLLRHKSMESFVTLRQRLEADSEYMSKGAAFLNAPAEAPAFKRLESSFMVAFAGMPSLETPAKAAGRVFQLRTYESPSVKTGQKKIEMFNKAEIKIFREVGLNPVFFGETLSGVKQPNLTYMLGFNSAEEQKEGWKKFGAHPEWQKLRVMPEYADKAILCGITNLSLMAAAYSQI